MRAPPSTGSERGTSHAIRRTGFLASQERTADSSSARSRGQGSGMGSTSVSPARASAPPHEGQSTLAFRHDLEVAGSDEPGVLARPVQRRGEGTEPVTDGGGLFESFGVRQPPHPCFERSEEPVRGLEGGEEIPDELSVALGVDPPSHGEGHRPIPARAQGANRVRAPIERVQRRSGTISSSASFASRAAPDPENGPRYAQPSPGRARWTTLSRGNASVGSSFR